MNSDTDILILLRKYQPYNKLHGRAADEIERLRTENRAVKDAYEHLAEISRSQRETMTKYLFPQEEQQ